MPRTPQRQPDVELDRPKLPHRRRENPWLGRALVFATCVVLADALFGERGLAQMLRVKHQFQQSISALTQLRNENAALREQMRRLQEDPLTIEGVARRELGLIRAGEILVVVKDAR